MYENNINPALAQMDLAQNEVATYALLVKRAQSSLTASVRAFERANETSTTGNCPVKQELTGKLRGHYLALTHCTSQHWLQPTRTSGSGRGGLYLTVEDRKRLL